MKNLIRLMMLVCILYGGCLAQSSNAKPRRTDTQVIDFILQFQEQHILGVAEAMPAEKYNFAPSNGGFNGVRTFGEQLKHIAADNYLLGSGIIGEKAPGDVSNDEKGSSSVRTKAEIIAYLKESFAYMRRAAATIDEANSPIPTPDISPWPAGTATRLGVAVEDCVHTWDHYGQLVEYLRMNGIVPPASRASDINTPVQGTSMNQALDFWISNTEKEVVSAADAMPEQKYAFAPAGSGFAGVRTFAEQVKHLAANNYRMAGRILGHTVTPDQEAETGPSDVRSKAEIMDYVRGSFVALHQAVASITSENILTPVLPARQGSTKQNTRVQFVVDAVAHSYDHYGQMVEYLRMNGIVPPASR